MNIVDIKRFINPSPFAFESHNGFVVLLHFFFSVTIFEEDPVVDGSVDLSSSHGPSSIKVYSEVINIVFF